LQQAITPNVEALATAYTLTGRITSSDLVEWMRRLSIELIRQSPSPIIRPCAVLAKVYHPLALELFNASFVSVWNNVFDYASASAIIIDDIPLINSFEIALESPQIPDHIRQVLLNLAEFLEMQDKSLPLDIQLLANQSHAANMFAKCLHYREIEFSSKNLAPSKECIEALISVNKQLGLREAASGVLEVVRHRFADTIPIQPTWLEKLHNWQEARLLYLHNSMKIKEADGAGATVQNPEWLANELGMLRCLRELGDNQELSRGASSLFSAMQVVEINRPEPAEDALLEAKLEVQRLGAHASWILGQWDAMETFLTDTSSKNSGALMRKNKSTIDLFSNISFYHIILAIHKQKYSKALNLITEIRKELSGGIRSLLNESYSRAYRAMVSMQVVTELEEVVHFKEYAANAISADSSALAKFDPSVGHVIDISEDLAAELSSRKTALMQKWRARIKCAPREVDVYRQILVIDLAFF
jgi:FKBP12-rapamycin complex-associated protein